VATEAISRAVLVVDASSDTEALFADPAVDEFGLTLERVADAAEAIARLDKGDPVDVVLLAPHMPDPVRVAQRLHSLDPNAAVVILVGPDRRCELEHALEVAPFLSGDVVATASGDPGALAPVLLDAARRSRARREGLVERRRPEDDVPPPLSARYLGTLLDSAPIGIVTLDAEGAVVGWNRRTSQMLGIAEVEALGTPFTQLWPASERGRIEALVASLESTGLSEPGETFERGELAFEMTGARFGTRAGDSGSIVVLQDVTQRVAAEREVLMQKALLEAQAESAISGIAVMTLDGRLQTVNSRWLDIWGVDEATLRSDPAGATESMIAQVEDAGAFIAGVEALIEGGGDYRDEVRLVDGRTIERFGAHVYGEDGAAIGRVWFHTDITERSRDEDALRFLAEATETLYSSLEYETTLRRVAELAVPRFADWCGVEVVGPRGLRNVAVAHHDPAKLQLARELQTRYPDPDDGSQGISRVVATGQAELHAGITDEVLAAAAVDEDHLRLLRELEMRSVVIVPMRAAGRTLGGISFISSHRDYDQHDLEFAQELARRAAIAIDNARVHAALRETARTLQESLLPAHLPAIDGVELAARFRPAGTGLEVGGDFYDIFETAEGQWGLVIGDVCGKGADAAAVTGLTRYTVRAAAMYEHTAAGVLRVLNEALLRQRSDLRFTTLAFCLLDIGSERSTLRAASGGHPRPLLLHRDGAAEALGVDGPLLGVVPDAEFKDIVVPVEPGDALVLYTDGLNDAHAPTRVLEESDLLAELERCRGLAAPEIAQRLEELAVGDSPELARDDIAVVVAKLGG
jgi:PAS domain S-box-containing protein